MIKGTRNQMHNVSNPHQGTTKRVLTVCSAGILRSATLQNYLIKTYGYNVRNCGTEASYALVPISEALVMWANEIIFVNVENYSNVAREITELQKNFNIVLNIKILNIPDIYGFNRPELLKICEEQYNKVKDLNDGTINIVDL